MAAARLTLCAAALALWAFGAGAQIVGDAARINGVPISAERLERSFDELLREKRINIAAIRNPAQAKRLKREALDALIEQELLWQQAQLGGVQVAPDEVERAVQAVRAGYSSPEAFAGRLQAEGYTAASYAEHLRRLLAARKVLEAAVAGVSVGDAPVRAFFDQNRARFDRPEQVRLRHVFLPFETGASPERQDAVRARMRDIAGLARAGVDFEQLALEHSAGASAARGGDLGWVQRQELAPALAEAAFALRAGQVSAVVELAEGLHLFHCVEHLPASTAEFALQRQRIAEYLTQQKADAERLAYVARLRAQARVEILVPLPSTPQPDDEPFGPGQRAREVQRRP